MSIKRNNQKDDYNDAMMIASNTMDYSFVMMTMMMMIMMMVTMMIMKVTMIMMMIVTGDNGGMSPAKITQG